jgi:amino acid transporter
LSILKRVFVGRPIATTAQEHQRLIKVVALAVFGSDAISSTAYAPEEILHVLVPTELESAIRFLIPISLIVIVLLAIVATSYYQTLYAYPNGGGSYVVSRENLGEKPSLVAGASLLVDYILTVAVSVSAGVAAVTSAVPELGPWRVWLCVGFVVMLTLANLRGLKESGRLFAGPTYLYIGALGLLIGVGLVRHYFGDLQALPPNTAALEEIGTGSAATGLALVFLLMRAFASGAVALTGVEAISNGVPAFRRPEPKNAAITLIAMAVTLGGFFFGISWLATELKPTLMEQSMDGYRTILAQLGVAVWGDSNIMFFVLQGATVAILLLAANTAYADFPRVASVIAQDGYLPRQMANRGDRLVFSNGIIILAVAASVLLIGFQGITTALIPLYAVGVFTCFTLSQLGMVRHHLRLREPKWRRGTIINTIGAVATGLVLFDVVFSKFLIGAWIVVVVIPIIILIFLFVKRHYTKVAKALRVPDDYKPTRRRHTVVVLVGRIHTGVLEAIAYARALNPDHLLAMTIVTDEDAQRRIEEQWQHYRIDVPLEIVYSPYRELYAPT